MNKGRILGIDLGLKRTGLAVSDELWITTRTLPTRTPKSRQADIEYILEICQQLDIQHIAIGYPLLPQSGEEGFMAKRARGFYEILLQKSLIPVYLIDESYSSYEAQKRIGNQPLDGESARILIENFIHAKTY